MAVQLFEHNQRAYRAVETMLSQVGKAAVIHPTGTGKSFIAFRLIENHPQARFLWLSPSDYIFKTQTESLRRSDPELSLENVTFLTYAKLMLLSPAQIGELQAEYIILDEFHRCGAERWGEGVQALIQSHPGTYLLGLSATNIRYLDNQRDIAQELFDGNVASEMTLGECIVRGILPKPKYVTTVFKYQQALEKYQTRITDTRSDAMRAIHQSCYDALRRALEQADGLDVILKKHITNPQGKYLIFCSDYEHLREMRNMTADWFQAINPEVHTYTAYSSDPGASSAFRDFKADDSEALKLLFCIDMLNEGVHVKGISGVILFRPTLSPIVYKQQIGRALTSGDSATPLILDVVNNFEGLYSISAIQKEMDAAILLMRENGEGNQIVVDRFTVEEQVHDCAELFRKLQDSLSAPWDHYFHAARQYSLTNGNLDVPKNYDTPEGLHLGQWLCTQRALYRNERSRLTQEQITRLESLGMQWQRCDDQRWDVNYQAALRFYEAHGHLRVNARYVTPEGIGLGRWIVNLRQRYQTSEAAGGLTESQIQQMEQIGMVWDNAQAQWQHHFGCAAAYYDEHGTLDVPVSYVTADGFSLGRWLTQMRTAKRGRNKRRLTEDQIAKLDSIGMQWEKRGDITWMESYAQARAYYDAHGNLDVSSTYVTDDGFQLGKWLCRQRYACQNPEKSNTVLTEERAAMLREIGLTLEKPDRPESPPPSEQREKRQELGIA
ncbi:MAG: Helicase associated domain protein [Candidatus Faecousia sp.]|nr:Helicase associated domain protein [Candidatus Faecousia sp.]